MIHLGDITKISGYDVPIVDCVIGGSPCQDLSVAGKRAGLDGERSGLFMEQIRITKEMREKDGCNGRTGEFVRPRFGVWENVPGALSSNKGEDFKAVLEEFAKVVDKDAVIPMPPKGKWNTSGCILGDGWSIAWRILDAQFWGVPQRRRRITLVADFGGRCAPEILFVRKGLSGHSSESREERQGITTDAQRGIAADDREGACIGFHLTQDPIVSENKTPCLSVGNPVSGQASIGVVIAIENYPADSRVNIDDSGKVQTLTSRMGTGGGNVPMVMEGVGCDIYNLTETGDVAASLTTATGQGASNTGPSVIVMDRSAYNQGVNANIKLGIDEDGIAFSCIAKGPGAVAYIDNSDIYCVDQGGGKSSANVTENLSPTLTCTHGGEPVICLQGNQIDQADTSVCNGSGWKEDTSYTLNTRDRHSVVYGQKPHYIVRRLTPMECERLQGYPDLWTDIGEYTDGKGKVKKTSDSARYKALGNSIALPPWKWVIKRLCSHYERDATMASLFDGIGGFPYLWEQINGKGTCLWASEIEDFPIAVTQKRID